MTRRGMKKATFYTTKWPFLYPLNPTQGCGGAGAYPSCHWERGRVHPGQVASLVYFIYSKITKCFINVQAAASLSLYFKLC